MLRRRWFLILIALLVAAPAAAQQGEAILLRPARVFDGVDPRPHMGWSVLVRGERIEAVGPNLAAPAGTRVMELPGMTLMPGMIEGHAHLFLHPYNETSWDDQVLREPLSMRAARAVAHARATLMAGFVVGSSLVAGFQTRSDDLSVLAPYVQRYVDVLPEFWDNRSIDEAETFTECLYPRYLVGDEVVAIIDRILEEGSLPSPALRTLREGRDGTLRAQRAQEYDRASAAATTPIG